MLERSRTLECTLRPSRAHDLERRSQELHTMTTSASKARVLKCSEFSSVVRSRALCALERALSNARTHPSARSRATQRPDGGWSPPSGGRTYPGSWRGPVGEVNAGDAVHQARLAADASSVLGGWGATHLRKLATSARVAWPGQAQPSKYWQGQARPSQANPDKAKLDQAGLSQARQSHRRARTANN
eukprot:1446461-Alexandrium_andersonii.AAC.2